MPTGRTIIEQTLDAQRRVFRIAQDPRRYGLTIKLIAGESGVGYDSLRNYAAGETMMPLCALRSLVGVVPDELLSMLMPSGRMIVQVPEELDPDTVGDACRDYLATLAAATHPASPGGREVVDCELEALGDRAARLKVVA